MGSTTPFHSKIEITSHVAIVIIVRLPQQCDGFLMVQKSAFAIWKATSAFKTLMAYIISHT